MILKANKNLKTLNKHKTRSEPFFHRHMKKMKEETFNPHFRRFFPADDGKCSKLGIKGIKHTENI